MSANPRYRHEDADIHPRGVAEHSHRSQLATDIVDNMKKDLVDFLDVPESHDVLIMQGTPTYTSLLTLS